MTITTTAYKTTVSGNGGTTTFSYAFEIPGATSTDQSYATLTYVDASGNATAIPNSQWSITGVNDGANGSASGTFTYPLTGSPIASGTTLTLQRDVPVEQLTSLSNQGSLFPSAVERAMDFVVMALQQVNGLFSRALVAPATDATAPGELPSATARANQLLGFDGSGNPIAAQPSSALVSTAMQPVVSASTLAAARTAMGLGALATEGFGSGLQDDGSGNARVIFSSVADATNQSVTAAFHNTERQATGALTYTLAKSSTLFSGFGFTVYALTGAITFAVDPADAFNGMPTGTSLIIPPGTHAFVSTDGAGTWNVSGVQQFSVDEPLNYQLLASVNSNNLTVAIKDRNGNDPSRSSPVIVPFRDPTIANGDAVLTAITAGISITAANGASLGTSNNTPFRLWIVAFNDGGTVRMGLINCLRVPSAGNYVIYPLAQDPIASSTQVSAGATSSLTFYTSGAAVSSKSYVILGSMSWEAGLPTAGAWSLAPTRVRLFGRGTKLPGDVLQSTHDASGTAVATANTYNFGVASAPVPSNGGQSLNRAFNMSSAANLLRIRAGAPVSSSVNSMVGIFIHNGTTTLTMSGGFVNSQAIASIACVSVDYLGQPATTSPVTYTLFFWTNAGTGWLNTFNGNAIAGGTLNTHLDMEEIVV